MKFRNLPILTAALAAGTAFAAEPVNLYTGEGVSIGNILFPSLNVQSAFGTSTADPADLLVGHHDPDRDGFTIQSIEISLRAQFGEHLSLFSAYAAKVDLDDDFDGEFEEYFAVVDGLPFGARLKGGRMLTQFGFHNKNHSHGFTMVDQNIANSRILGEHGLIIEGGELSFPVLRVLPAGWEDRLSVSFGRSITLHDDGGHDHGHGHGGEVEAPFEGESALFSSHVGTMNYDLMFAATSKTAHSAFVAGSWGENGSGRRTQVYGGGYEFLWREQGALRKSHREESEFFRWRTEAFVRRFGGVAGGLGGGAGEHEEEEHHEEEHHEEEHHEAHEDEEHEHDEHEENRGVARGTRRNFTDFAAYSVLTYGFQGGHWQAHLRGDYASRVADAGLPERWRVSPAVTWTPSHDLPLNLKLQYNYDHSPSFGDEHSVWLQFNLHWGSCFDQH